VHREIDGKIKQIVIKKHNSGKWVAHVCLEEGIRKAKRRIEKAIGIDMGINHFLSDSGGRQIENPRFYEKSLKRIRMEQKRLSKKKKDSRNREKRRTKLARAYERLTNQRDDFLHKLSRFYACNYDLAAIEDLNIENMVRNRRLAGKILDASWGKFLHLLEFKAARAGTLVVKVNPRGTSRESRYGGLDRDYNASLNILRKGLSGMGHPFEPVEMEPLRELIQVPARSIIEAGNPHHL